MSTTQGRQTDDDSDEVAWVAHCAALDECMPCAGHYGSHQVLCMQDEEAELLAELARIKKEREEEAAKRAAEEAAAAASNLQEELIRGNPLIIGKFDKSTSDFQVRCPLQGLHDSAMRTSVASSG